MKTYSWCLGLALLTLPQFVQSADLGMAAAPLQIEQWVKGKPVDLAAGKGKNIYVVEFWATWCGPCRESIPHLTKLQEKFKDKNVIIVGVSDEKLTTVQKFVKEMGSKMDYTIAIDREEKTSDAYMKAFEIEGIPHAFVVDKEGRVAWEGHPADGLEETLDELVSGKYDLQSVKLEKVLHSQVHEYLSAAEHGDKGIVNKALGEKLLVETVKFPHLLNELAWTILTEKDFEYRDYDFALRAAKSANELTKGTSPDHLDTYACALFKTGSVKEAIELQKKAVSLCKDKEMLADLKERLAEYEKKAAESAK